MRQTSQAKKEESPECPRSHLASVNRKTILRVTNPFLHLPVKRRRNFRQAPEMSPQGNVIRQTSACFSLAPQFASIHLSRRNLWITVQFRCCDLSNWTRFLQSPEWSVDTGRRRPCNDEAGFRTCARASKRARRVGKKNP